MASDRLARRPFALAIGAEFLSCTLFGLSYAAVKLGVRDASAFTLLAWRFFFAWVLLTLGAALGVIRLRLRGKNLWPLFRIALFQPLLYFLAQTYGISMTTVVESSTVLACMPLVTLLLSGVMLGERPVRRQWAGVAASVAGVILTSYVRGQGASWNALGYLLLLIAMSSDSLYVIFTKKAAGFSSLEMTYVSVTAGFLAFGACAFLEHALAGTVRQLVAWPFVDTAFLGAILYLSIGSQILAYTLCNFAIGVIGPAHSSAFVGIASATGVAAGWLFFGDPFSPGRLLGVALVLLGTWLASGSARQGLCEKRTGTKKRAGAN